MGTVHTNKNIINHCTLQLLVQTRIISLEKCLIELKINQKGLAFNSPCAVTSLQNFCHPSLQLAEKLKQIRP